MTITPNLPKVDPDGWYSATETAKILNINRKTLQKYEGYYGIRFKIGMSGRKKYSGRAIIKFWKDF